MTASTVAGGCAALAETGLALLLARRGRAGAAFHQHLIVAGALMVCIEAVAVLVATAAQGSRHLAGPALQGVTTTAACGPSPACTAPAARLPVAEAAALVRQVVTACLPLCLLLLGRRWQWQWQGLAAAKGGDSQQQRSASKAAADDAPDGSTIWRGVRGGATLQRGNGDSCCCQGSQDSATPASSQARAEVCPASAPAPTGAVAAAGVLTQHSPSTARPAAHGVLASSPAGPASAALSVTTALASDFSTAGSAASGSAVAARPARHQQVAASKVCVC
jgi:hypothetical protein